MRRHARFNASLFKVRGVGSGFKFNLEPGTLNRVERATLNIEQ